MELSDSLNAIHRSYAQSVGLLKGYLRHMGDAIKTLQKQQEEIVAKLEAAKSGDPDLTRPSSGEKTIKLNAEQLDALTKVMLDAEGNTAAYPNLTFRMSFVYLVALFDAFLADIFSEVVRARPTILKSSKKQISYDRLLEFETFEAMVEFIASRELNDLNYKSIKDQAEYYRDRFGVVIDDSSVSVSELVELRCTRNLLVHSNGIVNHIYLEQVSGSMYRSGDEVQVDAEYFGSAANSLGSVASFITAKLIEKHAGKPVGEAPIQLSEN